MHDRCAGSFILGNCLDMVCDATAIMANAANSIIVSEIGFITGRFNNAFNISSKMLKNIENISGVVFNV